MLAVLVMLTGLAATVPLLTRLLGRDAGYPLAAGYLAGCALLASRLPMVLDGGTIAVSARWLPDLDIAFALRMDGLAMVFGLLVLGVGALIMGYCPRYLTPDSRWTGLYTLLTLFTAAMLGLIFAADLLLLFLFWELTTVCSFFLIGLASPAAARPATRALLVTAGGGLALLAAVVVLIVTQGTSDLTTILAYPQRLLSSPAAWVVGALLIVAAFTKSAQFPFHFWLPSAMVAITPVSAYLHAATMVKAGIYLLIRFSPVYAAEVAWTVVLVLGGLGTALLGAFLALRQHDLKALLAYSTVSQLGLLVAVIGVGTPAALAAAILHTVAHALFKATLFMLVGIIDREAGSRDIRELSGLRRVMPVTATLTSLAAMSMAGLPPLLGFVSKEAIFEALIKTGIDPWLTPTAEILAVSASVLTFAYGARIVHQTFAGPTRQPDLYEPAWSFLAPAAVAALLSVVLGPAAALLGPLIDQATEDARPGGEAPYVAFWHGFTPGLWLSVLTVTLGLLLFIARDRVERVVQSVRLAPPGAQLFDHGYAGLLRIGRLVGEPSRYSSPAAHLFRPVLALVLLGAVGVHGLAALPAWPAGRTGTGDWPVLVLLAVALGGIVLVRSALAAIGLLGLVGLLVATWFLLAGAPDVALTLMLVEVLTAVVGMLVLRRLPARLPGARFQPVSAFAGALAIGAGVVAAAATIGLTGRRELSVAGDYFLRNAEPATGGSNVVNVILVDFRALDTLGEAAVLTAVALGLVGLFRVGGDRTGPDRGRPGGAGAHAGASEVVASSRPSRSGAIPPDLVLWFAHRLLAPVMLIVSAYLFLRGHDEPGGGFIAALVAGIAMGLGQLAAAGARLPLLGRLRPRVPIAAGLLLCLAVGLQPIAAGAPMLTPQYSPNLWLFGFSLTPVTIFDVGVYLMVLGLIAAAMSRLGAVDIVPADDGAVPAGDDAAAADHGATAADDGAAAADDGAAAAGSGARPAAGEVPGR
ncbi:proton-conducting transporter membrane subunit [Solwaraspora sp. WMMD406]|nr:hydrogen gas-evolving membrane-bound hydrogenase subunit E [Solwaraspora sp. WMMD406]MDG4765321.1 proton-conducting transporter membrane subunit [Solwaraspora sp. WMMD406]